mmetsp:Transcript_57168/g.129741  ORF Transcript_57168/g.129741 Transcript_57168/m.129741 type:complete len:407 (-) Transcript_57168:351-1571(-)
MLLSQPRCPGHSSGRIQPLHLHRLVPVALQGHEQLGLEDRALGEEPTEPDLLLLGNQFGCLGLEGPHNLPPLVVQSHPHQQQPGVLLNPGRRFVALLQVPPVQGTPPDPLDEEAALHQPLVPHVTTMGPVAVLDHLRRLLLLEHLQRGLRRLEDLLDVHHRLQLALPLHRHLEIAITNLDSHSSPVVEHPQHERPHNHVEQNHSQGEGGVVVLGSVGDLEELVSDRHEATLAELGVTAGLSGLLLVLLLREEADQVVLVPHKIGHLLGDAQKGLPVEMPNPLSPLAHHVVKSKILVLHWVWLALIPVVSRGGPGSFGAGGARGLGRGAVATGRRLLGLLLADGRNVLGHLGSQSVHRTMLSGPIRGQLRVELAGQNVHDLRSNGGVHTLKSQMVIRRQGRDIQGLP